MLPEQCLYYLLTEVFMWFDHLQTISRNRKGLLEKLKHTESERQRHRLPLWYLSLILVPRKFKWIGCEQCKSFHLNVLVMLLSQICLLVKIGCYIVHIVFKSP